MQHGCSSHCLSTQKAPSLRLCRLCRCRACDVCVAASRDGFVPQHFFSLQGTQRGAEGDKAANQHPAGWSTPAVRRAAKKGALTLAPGRGGRGSQRGAQQLRRKGEASGHVAASEPHQKRTSGDHGRHHRHRKGAKAER
eukprot:CAMPEP_0119317332 /NCGR_PEP_ID=MMETSP1333-20130426/42819_1 /TAXON_ID=418940 /ORGANISM="Scyphosphaera apsteinii, Strain RCC1455" /LENGTH=138 /DNA_ID=CAMNT_0007323233 /DNA_START=22 /DNA_END=434 /DNA_ORIENTATION=+